MGLVVVGFAGFGGSCLGIKTALRRKVDIAMNHNRIAMALHKANNPDTWHVVEDIWLSKPGVLCSHRRIRNRLVRLRRRREVDWAWFSPDCRDFSRAKGKRPVRKYVRGLAWVMVSWARAVRPKRMFLENVREFQQWGPCIRKLDEKGNPTFDKHGKPEWIPDPARRGQTFKKFVNALKALGYSIETKELDAKDYGAKTSRKRLVMIMRCDGRAIVWPKKTHGPDCAKPWGTAGECIDWSVPVRSIFEREKELKPNTLRRLAQGIKKFVLQNPRPFIVQVNHAGEEFRGQSIDKPLHTITGKHGTAVAMASIARIGQTGGNGSYCSDLNKPLTTITSKAEHLLEVATLMQVGYGERKGQAARVPGLDKPLGTVVAGGVKHALVSASVTKFYGTCAHGQSLEKPLPTVTSEGQHLGISAAFLSVYYGNEETGQGLESPLRTVVGKDRFALVVAFLREHKVIGENELPIVWLNGVAYVIVDIGMRMLTPRELARAQGFPDSYVLDVDAKGNKISKKDQVACIGNSVPPPLAEAIIRANKNAPRVSFAPMSLRGVA